METLKQDFWKIFRTERGILVLMVLNFLLSLALTIFAFVSLNPNGARTTFGYGDIGKYRSGSWVDILTFPILAVIFGILHNFLAMRIFNKKGGGMTKFFLVITTCLIVGAWLTLTRALGGV